MSLALHYWMRGAHHCSGPSISEMTYTVSSGTLKLYYTIPYLLSHLDLEWLGLWFRPLVMRWSLCTIKSGSNYAVGDDQAAELVDDEHVDRRRRSTEPLLEYLQHWLHRTRRVLQRHRDVSQRQYRVVQDHRRLPATTSHIGCIISITAELLAVSRQSQPEADTSHEPPVTFLFIYLFIYYTVYIAR